MLANLSGREPSGSARATSMNPVGHGLSCSLMRADEIVSGGDTEAEAAVTRRAYGGSRPNIRALVPEGAGRVLDVGCATGAVGAALKQGRRVEVVGLELDPAAAAAAREVLDEVHQGDAEQLLADEGTVERLGRFDCIIAADVLEHMAWPDRALAILGSMLEPRGTIVLCVPNVRHWRVIHALLIRGRWPREPAGIFDRTHLRWFTRADLAEMIAVAGLEAERWEAVDEGSSWRRGLYRAMSATPLAPFITRQYVVVASRSPEWAPPDRGSGE